jgi:hypothetical protein
MMCDRCRYVQVEVKRGHGVRSLYETRTGLPHNCDFSEPKYCPCGTLIYLDSKVLSPTGKMIPLNYSDDCYHFCKEVKMNA